MGRSNDEAPDEESDQHDVVALARRHIGMGGRVFYAPSIPREKEQSARFAHDLHLPDEETILVLHDGTVFGSAEEGFVVTRHRLCWKNPWEYARQIAWSDLDPAAIRRDVGKVILAGGDIALSGELVLGVSRFLLAMTGITRGVELGPYRGAGRHAASLEAAMLPGERIIALARALVGEVSDVFYAPSIPHSKLQHARAAHSAHLPRDEAVAVLYDDTFFGSAEEGFLLTSKRLCWKSLTEPPTQLPWGVIDAETISASGSYVEVMGGEIKLTSRGDLSGAVATLLRRIAEEACAGSRQR
jgi:hypothetical protein